MRSFKDKERRDWELVVDVGQIKRVRDLVKVDLYRIDTESERLFGDPVLLVDTLYVLCKTQCESRKFTDEDFGRGLDGDSLHEASNAVMDAVIDFFPSS